jgi:hypothetical protein
MDFVLKVYVNVNLATSAMIALRKLALITVLIMAIVMRIPNASVNQALKAQIVVKRAVPINVAEEVYVTGLNQLSQHVCVLRVSQA